MIIKRILIVDDNEGEAGEYLFAPGANLLVSKDNSQGKSSLLKTLYYGLGLDITRFPSMWSPKKMSIKIDMFNERTNENLYILRKKDLFYVSGQSEPLNASEYTRWLSEKLGVDLKLTYKATKLIGSISRPSALLTPFYIDQDESWSGRLYSSSNEVSMYLETPQRIFDYILNISDDADLLAKERIALLKDKKKASAVKRKNVNDVYMDYIEDYNEGLVHDISDIMRPISENKQNIEIFIKLVDSANKKYLEYKAVRVKLQRELDQKQKSLEEYKTILAMYKADYEIIKSICKHCGSELTKEQVRARMEISSNIYELEYLIDLTNKEISDVSAKIKKASSVEESTYQEYLRLSQEVDLAPEIKTIAEYVDAASKKKSQDEFASIIQKLDTEIAKLDSEIKDLSAERRESAKTVKILVEKIEKSYQEYTNDLSTIMRGSNINNIDFKDFKAPASSGVNDNQAYLGAYLAYMRLVSDYGRYLMPFCIDSFIKNETSDERLKAMFEATEKYLLKVKGQSIFSAIESSVERFMNKSEEYNKVTLGERLLSKDAFKAGVGEVAEIISK